MSVKLYSKEKWGVCKCGHYQWQHDDSVILPDGLPEGRGDGHGRCGVNGCSCKQFTWNNSIKAKRNFRKILELAVQKREKR
jgi:hypothetical protein